MIAAAAWPNCSRETDPFESPDATGSAVRPETPAQWHPPSSIKRAIHGTDGRCFAPGHDDARPSTVPHRLFRTRPLDGQVVNYSAGTADTGRNVDPRPHLKRNVLPCVARMIGETHMGFRPLQRTGQFKMQILRLGGLRPGGLKDALTGHLSLHDDKSCEQQVKVVVPRPKDAAPCAEKTVQLAEKAVPLAEKAVPLAEKAAQLIERSQQDKVAAPQDEDDEDVKQRLEKLRQLLAERDRRHANAEEKNSKKPNGDRPRCDPSAREGSNPPPASPTPVQKPAPNNHGVGTDREIGRTQWMKHAIVLMAPVIIIVSIFSAIHLAMNGEGATANIIAVVGILGGFAWGAYCVWLFWGRKS